MSKSLLAEFVEAIDRYRDGRREQQATSPAPQPSRLRGWLPTKGNVAFTLVVVACLVFASRAGALPLGAPAAGDRQCCALCDGRHAAGRAGRGAG